MPKPKLCIAQRRHGARVLIVVASVDTVICTSLDNEVSATLVVSDVHPVESVCQSAAHYIASAAPPPPRTHTSLPISWDQQVEVIKRTSKDRLNPHQPGACTSYSEIKSRESGLQTAGADDLHLDIAWHCCNTEASNHRWQCVHMHCRCSPGEALGGGGGCD